jgi:hypothetical protein
MVEAGKSWLKNLLPNATVSGLAKEPEGSKSSSSTPSTLRSARGGGGCYVLRRLVASPVSRLHCRLLSRGVASKIIPMQVSPPGLKQTRRPVSTCAVPPSERPDRYSPNRSDNQPERVRGFIIFLSVLTTCQRFLFARVWQFARRSGLCPGAFR